MATQYLKFIKLTANGTPCQVKDPEAADTAITTSEIDALFSAASTVQEATEV